MTIESRVENIQSTDEKVFGLLSDCRQLGQHIPPQQVQNLQTGDNYCSFDVNGVASFRLELAEALKYSKICYSITNDKGIPMGCRFDINGNGTGCTLQMSVEAGIPIFLAGMVKGPMQKVADTIIGKIKEAAEKQ
ncbi:MAG: hypothetical protein J5642_03270 [Bacteroidales bacterium]|nr:hypothetical protein [Bacteroidales bacterium]